MSILIACRGCGVELASENATKGRCAECTVKLAVAGQRSEYTRLWRKRASYAAKGISTAKTDKQLVRCAMRVVNTAHRMLPSNGTAARDLANTELAAGRADADGFGRIEPVTAGQLIKPGRLNLAAS